MDGAIGGLGVTGRSVLFRHGIVPSCYWNSAHWVLFLIPDSLVKELEIDRLFVLAAMAIATALLAFQTSVTQSPWLSLGLALLLLPFAYVVLNEFIRSSARVQGMRGPTGLPLIGNLAQIRTNAAEQYRAWSREFGPVYQIQLGNIPVVVVNSAASAKILFSQNAQALSSRPEFYTFHKVSTHPPRQFKVLRID